MELQRLEHTKNNYTVNISKYTLIYWETTAISSLYEAVRW